jgi:hypothetical protein
MIRVLTLNEAAKIIGCSKATVCRAANKANVGFVAGNRLMGLTREDVASLRKYVHDTAGNPDWIAGRRKPRRG